MRALCLASLLIGLVAAERGLAQATSQATQSNTVDVFGMRREAEAVERPGMSYIMRPTDATRFDTKSQLARSSSLALPDTGRINASGFVVPRIRGQETRLTEVYVGDLLLQDPYSGLPLVDDLDLRAFGELALHQGSAPLDLPTIGGAGIVQYRPRSITEDSVVIGAGGGRPYGAMGFGTISARRDGLGLRLYVREHVTDGRYSYFDDGGTPFNVADDTERMRTGNDRRSRQFVPTLQWRQGPHALHAVGLWQKGEGSLPATHANDTPSRDESGTHLSQLRYEREFGAVTLRSSVAHHDDIRERADGGDAIGSATADRLAVRTRRIGLGAAWFLPEHELRGDLDAMRTGVNQRSATSAAFRRDSQGGHAGWGWMPSSNWRLETKALLRQHTDIGDAQARGDQLVSAGDRRRLMRGASTSLGWRDATRSVYGQLASRERPPSLLEEFGDAAYVRGNPELLNEKSRHFELGGRMSDVTRTVAVAAALFKDDATDRLLFAPSLAQSVRAINIGRAEVRGVDTSIDLNFDGSGTSSVLSVTRLWPEDRTSPDLVRQLPAVPAWQANLLLAQTFGAFTARWQSRYRGEFYRDVLNDVQMPASLIHTASCDVAWQIASDVSFDAGVVIDNVTDVKSVEIDARGGASQSGETAYSDVGGFPLPGRQWRAISSLSYRL